MWCVQVGYRRVVSVASLISMKTSPDAERSRERRLSIVLGGCKV
jgi:hypothetical protein